jgi:hypothetical protein
VISYDSQRGGVSVITEKGDITTSYLLIQNADLADSGRYSCSPSNADVASVRVHVLNGNLDFFFLKMENLSRLYRITIANHVHVPLRMSQNGYFAAIIAGRKFVLAFSIIFASHKSLTLPRTNNLSVTVDTR